MNAKRTGAGLMVLGGLIAVVGLIGLLSDRAARSDGDPPVASGETTGSGETAGTEGTGVAPDDVERTDADTNESATTTSEPGGTSATTSPPTTVAAVTTQAPIASAPTTTTADATTTQPPAALAPDDQIVAFVDDFVAWIAVGDVSALLNSLHPAVGNRFGAELCAAFIEDEILNLVEYRTAGAVEGPQDLVFGDETFPVYTVSVSFTYQGADFEDTAAFGIVEGEVRWFTTCR